jgi:hypothetical protein
MGKRFLTEGKLRYESEENGRCCSSAASLASASWRSLQYWVASCRTLGEALLNRYLLGKQSAENEYLLRARTILTEAASNISANEHPHQWGEIQTQLARCDNLSAKRAPRA